MNDFLKNNYSNERAVSQLYDFLTNYCVEEKKFINFAIANHLRNHDLWVGGGFVDSPETRF